MTIKPKLVAVQPLPQRSPEESLRYLIPHLADLERLVGNLRVQVGEEGRRLARKRGVSFIRDEHLRREFGA